METRLDAPVDILLADQVGGQAIVLLVSRALFHLRSPQVVRLVSRLGNQVDIHQIDQLLVLLNNLVDSLLVLLLLFLQRNPLVSHPGFRVVNRLGARRGSHQSGPQPSLLQFQVEVVWAASRLIRSTQTARCRPFQSVVFPLVRMTL